MIDDGAPDPDVTPPHGSPSPVPHDAVDHRVGPGEGRHFVPPPAIDDDWRERDKLHDEIDMAIMQAHELLRRAVRKRADAAWPPIEMRLAMAEQTLIGLVERKDPTAVGKLGMVRSLLGKYS